MAGSSGTIDPYDPVCGNVHFAPNGRRHYDLDGEAEVSTTCRTFGDPGGAVAEPFTGAELDPYRDLAPDCMGPFLVWWRQQVAGLGSAGVDALGEPLRNWWVYLYY